MIKALEAFQKFPFINRVLRPKKIAIVTTLPEVFEVMTGGLDAFGCSRVSITPFSIHNFLGKHDIENIKVTLYFAPALTSDRWGQLGCSELAQLCSALNAEQYDSVINICQSDDDAYKNSLFDAKQELGNKIPEIRFWPLPINSNYTGLLIDKLSEISKSKGFLKNVKFGKNPTP